MSPLVSIIIPVYNSEYHVAETISSALGQTYKNVEVIVVDDGSADDSLVIARKFEGERVKIFHQPNKGASAARNKGLAEASGEFIQFLDADDLLSANKIEAQIEQLVRCPGYLGLCNTIHFNDGEEPPKQPVIDNDWYSKGSDNPVDFLLKLYGGDALGESYGGMITIHAWLSPKYILDKAGPWNEGLIVDDDGEYFCRVILASNGVKFNFEAVSYYRKHLTNQSLSSQKSLEAFENMLTSTNLKFSYLRRHTASDVVERAFAGHYWEIGVASYPRYRALSKEAINTAVAYNFKGIKYKAGPVSTFLSRIIGWRATRILTYLRYKA